MVASDQIAERALQPRERASRQLVDRNGLLLVLPDGRVRAERAGARRARHARRERLEVSVVVAVVAAERSTGAVAIIIIRSNGAARPLGRARRCGGRARRLALVCAVLILLVALAAHAVRRRSGGRAAGGGRADGLVATAIVFVVVVALAARCAARLDALVLWDLLEERAVHDGDRRVHVLLEHRRAQAQLGKRA